MDKECGSGSETNKEASTHIDKSNNPRQDDTAPDETAEKPLYFNKDGKLQFGITPPTAFALSYPYPPLPSNLAKNRVLRALDEPTKENLQEGIEEAEREFEKEAMPLPRLALQGSPLPKVLIPEIELALYWDRHPYEFRVSDKEQSTIKSLCNRSGVNNCPGSMQRSKSEINLASKVGELLEQQSIAENGNSRRSSASASNKTIRSSTVTADSLLKHERCELSSPCDGHYENHLALVSNDSASNRINNGNRCTNGKCGSANNSNSSKFSSNNKNFAVDGANKERLINKNGKSHNLADRNNANTNESVPMSESERKKFKDIQLFRHQNDRQGQGNQSRPKLVRSQEQMENSLKKSAGVQVTIDDVTAAAMKSTYLCPLHGQYKRGIERRDKGGFRTDMSPWNDVHAHCSRALKGKPSKTKMIKTTETQTEDECVFPFQSTDSTICKRSKTAGNVRNPEKSKDTMASEYHGSFRDPYKIAESEKRHLRNKILNYCFTKHSIF